MGSSTKPPSRKEEFPLSMGTTRWWWQEVAQFEPIPLAVTFDSPGRADAPAGHAQWQAIAVATATLGLGTRKGA